MDAPGLFWSGVIVLPRTEVFPSRSSYTQIAWGSSEEKKASEIENKHIWQ